jgi:DNA-binding NarL/FixJ family response regulator
MTPQKRPRKKGRNLAVSPLQLTLLLLTGDDALSALVREMAEPPWKLAHHSIRELKTSNAFAQPNVRLVILDDQAANESDRGWLLAQIRRRFPGTSLLYIAESQSDDNERRARTNGAQYYVSRPLAAERFGHVLRSFLQSEQTKGLTPGSPKEEPTMIAEKEPTARSFERIEAGIHRLTEELNSEDSQLRTSLLDAALAGLRLSRNPESRNLRRDAAKIWTAMEPTLSHHLVAEDHQLLPWLDQQDGLSPDVARMIRDCHDELRVLMDRIVNGGADHLTEDEARDAGRALSRLAVCLDDAIDDEKRKLLPAIQRALFATVRNS